MKSYEVSGTDLVVSRISFGCASLGGWYGQPVSHQGHSHELFTEDGVWGADGPEPNRCIVLALFWLAQILIGLGIYVLRQYG